MIKPPFTAKQGLSSVWLEDSEGVSVCDINPLIESSEAFKIAELLANGTNSYLRMIERNKENAKNAGRPPLKKPSPFALAKRKSRAKAKQKKSE